MNISAEKYERTLFMLVDFTAALELLLRKLLDKGIPHRLVRWIANFLQDRRACATVDGACQMLSNDVKCASVSVKASCKWLCVVRG